MSDCNNNLAINYQVGVCHNIRLLSAAGNCLILSVESNTQPEISFQMKSGILVLLVFIARYYGVANSVCVSSQITGSGAGSNGLGSGSPPTTSTSPVVKKTTTKSDDYVIKCGTRAPNIGRIVGGSLAQAKRWPWQVGIKSCSNCTFFCGGTIVAKKWVVTAAHCVVNRRISDLLIDAGVTQQGKNTKHKQSFNCTSKYSHQSYAINAPYDEDIAVLKLNKKVVFNDHVRPLCLNEKRLNASQQCSVTGFGKTKQKGLKSMSLLEADVPIVAHDVCVQSYNKTKPPRPVTKNMLCAGYSTGGIDSCEGDSGGPLTCWDESKRRHVLGGIVSWGVGCARANHYGVYTDVQHLTSWITKITGKIQ